MKATFTFLLLALLSVGVAAQYALPVTFENPQEDTAWTVFANVGDPEPAENFVLADNPDDGGINTSAKCIQFTVVATASPWAGAFSDYYGTVEVTDAQNIFQMMVYKNVITNCCFKLEGTGVDPKEVKVPNTVINQWELITFDFSDVIGNSYNRVVIFPDFPDARTEGSVTYMDNIGFEGVSSLRKYNGSTLSVFPNPAYDVINLQYPDMKGCTISNIIGQNVRTVDFGNAYQQTINVSDLRAGVYFITVDTADGQVSTKFIKK